jgi:inosine triphosphate pyrophosphatase
MAVMYPTITAAILPCRTHSLSTSCRPLRDTDDTRPAAKRQKTDGNKPTVTFVTGNKKKLEEVKRIMGDDGNDGATTKLPFVITNRKVDLPELQGDPIDIAKNKCSAAARQVGGAVITEDTSLCFTALKGLPGPYIKWFLDGLGHDGLNNLIASSNDKSAYAQTLVAFCPGPGKDVVVFDGRTMGKIVPARGSLAFGWDPIFEPDEGGGLTYAEMTKEGKDAISHRSRAFSQLRDYFIKENEAISSQI